eukprot:Rmarinus@m.19074
MKPDSELPVPLPADVWEPTDEVAPNLGTVVSASTAVGQQQPTRDYEKEMLEQRVRFLEETVQRLIQQQNVAPGTEKNSTEPTHTQPLSATALPHAQPIGDMFLAHNPGPALSQIPEEEGPPILSRQESSYSHTGTTTSTEMETEEVTSTGILGLEDCEVFAFDSTDAGMMMMRNPTDGLSSFDGSSINAECFSTPPISPHHQYCVDPRRGQQLRAPIKRSHSLTGLPEDSSTLSPATAHLPYRSTSSNSLSAMDRTSVASSISPSTPSMIGDGGSVGMTVASSPGEDSQFSVQSVSIGQPQRSRSLLAASLQEHESLLRQENDQPHEITAMLQATMLQSATVPIITQPISPQQTHPQHPPAPTSSTTALTTPGTSPSRSQHSTHVSPRPPPRSPVRPQLQVEVTPADADMAMYMGGGMPGGLPMRHHVLPQKRIGTLTPEERARVLERHRRRRERRINEMKRMHGKETGDDSKISHVAYKCRKRIADMRPRIGGRFAKTSCVIRASNSAPNLQDFADGSSTSSVAVGSEGQLSAQTLAS